MRITVLGSAAGGGFPQWNCNCRNCDGVRGGTHPRHGRARSRPSPSPPTTPSTGCCSTPRPTCSQQIRAIPCPAAGARPARHGDRRHRADGRRRSTTPPGLLHAARGAAAPLPLWCTDPVRGRPDATAIRCCACSTHYCGVELACASRSTAAPFEVAGRRRPALRRAAAASKAAAVFAAPRTSRVAGDNIGLRDHRHARAAARCSTRPGWARSSRRCATR